MAEFPYSNDFYEKHGKKYPFKPKFTYSLGDATPSDEDTDFGTYGYVVYLTRRWNEPRTIFVLPHVIRKNDLSYIFIPLCNNEPNNPIVLIAQKSRELYWKTMVEIRPLMAYFGHYHGCACFECEDGNAPFFNELMKDYYKQGVTKYIPKEY